MALTERQREIRRTGISASEIATLADLNPWSSPAEIFEEKVNPTEKKASLRMELGDLGEEPIAQLYARRTGFHLLHCDTLRHPEKTIALATPDRLCFLEPPARGAGPKDASHLLQIKWSGWRQREEWGPPGTDEVPAAYACQVQWEMFVSGVPKAHVGVLFDRDEFLTYELELDTELVGGLLEIAERFWVDHVLSRTPPPPDASKRYAEVLGRLHPRETPGIFKPSTGEIEGIADELRALEQSRKDMEDKIARLCNELRSFIGDAEGVETAAGKVTWKACRPKLETDWEALARQIATVLERVRPSSPVVLPRLSELVRAHTRAKPGTRVLRKSWAK